MVSALCGSGGYSRPISTIVYAKNGIDARKAYDELVAKWTPLAPAVVRSLEEAGNQLLTFYEFPRVMWKSIRTTNALENLNREFRRRTKTQALPGTFEDRPHLHSERVQVAGLVGSEYGDRVYPRLAQQQCAYDPKRGGRVGIDVDSRRGLTPTAGNNRR